MPEEPDLLPANPDDLRQTIGYALRFNNGKPHRTATDDMARIAADIIVRQLERSGYVILQRPPAAAPKASYDPPGRGSRE